MVAWGECLPGRVTIARGTMDDYRALAHLHYVAGDPAVIAGVWKAQWDDCRSPICDCGLKDAPPDSSNRQSAIGNRQLIGVAVVCYPPAASLARERALSLSGPRYGPKLQFINQHVRTIARVIVHPTYRSLGVASELVRRVLEECPTRYVEAFATMGEVHPFFERAGMKRVEAGYFLFDRAQSR